MTQITRSTAVATLNDLIDELTEIRDAYQDSLIPIYVKTPGWDELIVSVEETKLTDGSEVYDVIVEPRTHVATPAA